MVRVQIQSNARSLDIVVVELLHQYNVRQAMLPHNVQLLLVTQPHGLLHGQEAPHLAHIDQVDTGRAQGDALQARLCANSPNDVFQ